MQTSNYSFDFMIRVQDGRFWMLIIQNGS